MQITLVQGDITQEDVDAVVNAANTGLRGGGGVDVQLPQELHAPGRGLPPA